MPDIDISALSGASWATVGAILALLLLVSVIRAWKRHDEYVEELKRAEDAYRDAVKSRDPDAVSIAARRLREIRSKVGDK